MRVPCHVLHQLAAVFDSDRGRAAVGLLLQYGLSLWKVNFALGAIANGLDMAELLRTYRPDFVSTLARLLTPEQCFKLALFAKSSEWLADDEVATSRSPFYLCVQEASSALGCTLAAELALTREERENLLPAVIIAITRRGLPAMDERAHLQILVSVLLSVSHVKRELPAQYFMRVYVLVFGVSRRMHVLESSVLVCLTQDRTLHRVVQDTPCSPIIIVPKFTGSFDARLPFTNSDGLQVLCSLAKEEQQARRGMKRLREPVNAIPVNVVDDE